MATFDAAKVRAVAIELKERIFDLYIALLPSHTTANAWTLNGSDPALPTPFEVRVQLEQYEALLKIDLRLRDWVVELKQAQPDDYLTFPPAPVFFDGGNFFDGGGAPE